MTVPIDVAYVSAVLLVDGWHHVSPGSFVLDRYHFVTMSEEQVKEGTFDVVYPDEVEPGLWGFAFVEQDSITSELRNVSGPMSSMLAFRYATRPEDRDYGDEVGMTTY